MVKNTTGFVKSTGVTEEIQMDFSVLELGLFKIIIKLLSLNLSGGESGEKKKVLESVSFFPLSLGLLSFLKS